MMPLSEIFFLAIVLYLLYRFIFNFLLPVYKATKQVRQQFRNMQDPMRDPRGPSQAPFTGSEDPSHAQKQGSRSSGKAPAGDYIDFEEIK